MGFVDGMVAAVPNGNKAAFTENARKWAEIFKKYGAVKVVDNWGVEVPDGEVTSFPMAVKKEADETVVFSWIVWPSKEVHDAGWAKITEDGVMDNANMAMPFDGKRMIFGQFETVMEA